MATNLNEAEFNLANGDYIISEHCRELRRQVQLAKEIRLKDINDPSDEMFKQIDSFEKDRMNAYLALNREQQSSKLKEITKIDALNASDELIEKRSSESKWFGFKNQNFINESIYNQTKLEYRENKSKLSSDVLGNLKWHSTLEINKKEFEKIDFSARKKQNHF